jgi:secreted PhoX family phosphatase
MSSPVRSAVVTVATATGAAVVGTGAQVAQAAQAAEEGAAARAGHAAGKAARGLRFTPVAPNTADAVTVPGGYGPECRHPLG